MDWFGFLQGGTRAAGGIGALEFAGALSGGTLRALGLAAAQGCIATGPAMIVCGAGAVVIVGGVIWYARTHGEQKQIRDAISETTGTTCTDSQYREMRDDMHRCDAEGSDRNGRRRNREYRELREWAESLFGRGR